MRREGEWALALPLEETQSADFMSDSDTCSIICTPTSSQDSSQRATSISIMAGVNALDAHEASQTKSPNTSTVFQDVQPDHDVPADCGNTNQSSNFATPPPTRDCLGRTCSNNQSSFTNDTIRRSSKKVYDIETLVKLRGCSGATTIMLKVKPEAIAENLFQIMGTNRALQLPERSRGLSDISRGSLNSMEDDVSVICNRSGFMSQPFRQPHAPPENSVLQQHEGFARFLKQHASPPHHRVTAGGRIVPTGPLSPPPMLDFGSLNSLVQGRQAKNEIVTKEDRHILSGKQAPNVHSQACSSTTVGGHIPTRNDNTLRHRLAHPVLAPGAAYTGNVANGAQTYVNPMIQPSPAAAVTLGILQDGSTLVSCNGFLYQTFWNGTNTIIEPLQAGPAPLVVQAYPALYPRFAQQGHDHALGAPAAFNQSERLPLAGSSDETLDHKPQLRGLSQDQTTHNDDVTLKVRLKNLDKHLALYHFEIGPAERASLVKYRKFLVKEIDKIRVDRDSTNSAIPIVASADQFSRISSGPLRSVSGNNPAPPLNIRSASQRAQTAMDGVFKKLLSPVAPPFVPGSLQIGSGGIPKETAKPKNPDAAFNSKDTTLVNDFPFGVSTSDSVSAAKFNSDSYSEDQSYKPLDPRDPAMRIIHHDDIEYAARYMYGLTRDTKKFCTTVSEFQEVIRQVREQARLYGCAGGSSKDPAYDAEQDIWWAICDRDPIPLPSKTPDYVTDPRPWNWNDSAFNIRRGNDISAEMPPMDARTSPRFQGLTPAEAERSKDTMDVSRSYYALHGQLSSVSFRPHVYDEDNKVTHVESNRIRKAIEPEASICPIKSESSSVRETKVPRQMPSTNEAAAALSLGTGPAAGYSHEMGTENRHHCHSTSGQSEVKAQPAFYVSIRAVANPVASQNHCLDVQARHNTESKAPHRPYQAYAEDVTATPLRSGLKSTSHAQTEAKKGTEDVSLDQLCEVDESSKSVGTSRHETRVLDDWHRLANGDRASHPSTFNKSGTNPGKSDHKTLCCYRDYLKENSATGSSKSRIAAQAVPPSRFAFPGNLNPTKEELGARYRAAHGGPPTGHKDGYLTGWDQFIVEHSATDWPDRIELEEWEKIALHGLPVAESKSQWGPEEEAVADDPRYQWVGSGYERRSDINEREIKQAKAMEAAKKPKVNIPKSKINYEHHDPDYESKVSDPYDFPHAAAFRSNDAPLSSEVKSINAKSASNKNSHDFLLGMLKSPRYSHVQTNPSHATMDPLMAWQYREYARIEEDYAKKEADKENVARGYRNGILGSKTGLKMSMGHPDMAINKAPSSLASSTYQARGYLPQYDGAGKAHTSSVFHQNKHQALPQQARVNLVGESTYQSGPNPQPSYKNGPNPIGAAHRQVHSKTGSHTTTSGHYGSAKWGFDGSEETPPRADGAASTVRANQPDRPDFDYKGVTTADYIRQRPDPNNAWHRGAVNDFFDDLGEKEFKKMMLHQRVKTKTAP